MFQTINQIVIFPNMGQNDDPRTQRKHLVIFSSPWRFILSAFLCCGSLQHLERLGALHG